MPERRVAVIAGCRTPFARSGTALRDLSAVDLGKACVRELLERSEVEPAAIGAVVMGQVVPSLQAPNLAREVGLGVGLPKEVPAHTVNRACASASQAIADVAAEIRLGNLDAGIAGGAESLSNVPIPLSRRLARTLVEAQRARSAGARLGAFARLRPRDLVPEWPAVAEPSTGLTMGQSAEKMAKENGITREEQDEIALASHRNGWAATEDGRLPGETCAVFVPPRYEAVTGDNLLRRDTSTEALAALPPAFDKRNGSVTAGNSSALTDGAAAVLLMSEDKARAEGRQPLAYVRSWAVAAVDPGGQLLMGPALAVPKALERAGIELRDVDLIEMHEAFAAQVASNIQALESEAWAREKLGRSQAVGRVDRSKLNVNGGSIALGHPFGATGARLVTTLANEMARRGVHLGLVSVCAQGGMGFAMVLER
jgi:acetyl-CoA acyltransferase